jgi:hypothetical protein
MVIAPRSADTNPEDESLETMTREEGLLLIDRQARKFLGMSGVEFVKSYREGKLDNPHRLEVARVAILLPLAEL